MNDFVEKLDAMGTELRRYSLLALPSHLASAGQKGRLRSILWSFDFLQAKLENADSNALISDLGLLAEEGIDLVQSAVRMSAHAIDRDRAQLASQLVGRLGMYAHTYPKLGLFLDAAQHADLPALLPQSSLLDAQEDRFCGPFPDTNYPSM